MEGRGHNTSPRCGNQVRRPRHATLSMCLSKSVIGTYGGHLELCAFAHLKQRNVKVIQPGLVYVIEWSTGPNAAETEPVASSSTAADLSITSSSTSATTQASDATLSSREQRKARRDRLKDAKDQKARQALATPPPESQSSDLPTLYVAYHDWEHFSSVRNISGPHQGIPNVVETPPDDIDEEPLANTARSRIQKVALHVKSAPDVRSPSPSTTTGTTSTQATDASSSLSSGPPRTPPESMIANAAHAIFNSRSPKRSFEESDEVNGGEEGSGSDYGRASSKRTRPRGLSVNEEQAVEGVDADGDADADVDGEPLTSEDDDEDESVAETSSVYSSSAAHSPVPPQRLPKSAVSARRSTAGMTRRERKRLARSGTLVPAPTLAKPKRVILLLGKKGDRTATEEGRSEAGKDGKAEWMTNGTGKMDVRGFRELKI